MTCESTKPPLVLYHKGCVDGWCSAWVARRAFMEQAEFPGDWFDTAQFVPWDYQTPPPSIEDYEGRAVYILDFSFDRPVLKEMIKHAAKLVLLDHHKTAKAALEGLPEELTEEGIQIPVEIVFDMEKSGALLSWEYFFPERKKAVPWIIRYVMDRDLWTWQLPLSGAVNAALYSYPFDFDLWCNLNRYASHTSLAEQGKHILRFQNKCVERGIKYAREVTLAGYKVLAYNTPFFQSEIAGALAEGRPFGVCWSQEQDGRYRFDLRSREDGVDVGQIAKQFGGGGHKHSAGFKVWEFPFSKE